METAAAPNAAKPKSRRRWYQYSLRTLLIFVTLAGCALGWLGPKVQQARYQQAAVDMIARQGGCFEYDYEYDAQENFVRHTAPPGPTWLHKLLGVDFFRNIHSGCLDNPYITDAHVRLLSGFTTLRVLTLDC